PKFQLPTRHERVVAPRLDGLEGVVRREVVRGGSVHDVGVAEPVHREGLADRVREWVCAGYRHVEPPATHSLTPNGLRASARPFLWFRPGRPRAGSSGIGGAVYFRLAPAARSRRTALSASAALSKPKETANLVPSAVAEYPRRLIPASASRRTRR